jgi:hypothetical protein
VLVNAPWRAKRASDEMLFIRQVVDNPIQAGGQDVQP